MNKNRYLLARLNDAEMAICEAQSMLDELASLVGGGQRGSRLAKLRRDLSLAEQAVLDAAEEFDDYTRSKKDGR